MCGNHSLALGSYTVFYQCLSGTFYNLYDESVGGQCSPVNIVAHPSTTSVKQPSEILSPQQVEAVAGRVGAILGTVAPSSEIPRAAHKRVETRDTSDAAAHWDGVLAPGCPMIHLEGPSKDQILRQIHCMNPNYPNRAADGSCNNYCDHPIKRDIDVRDTAAEAVHWDGVTALGCPMITLYGPSLDNILAQIHCINPNYPNRSPDGSCKTRCDYFIKRAAGLGNETTSDARQFNLPPLRGQWGVAGKWHVQVVRAGS